jgi:glycosyltransferase involved in cell wall biosynthesis
LRVGIVFHKDPFAPPTGIDLVRLRAIARGLVFRGVQAEIIAPVKEPGTIEDVIPVYPLEVLGQPGRYQLIKTCYHYSVLLIDGYDGPLVSRIVRVVDDRLPERDEPFRNKLLTCQEIIKDRANVLVLNNQQNKDRWRALYGQDPPIAIIPTGCPTELPRSRGNPYNPDERVMLFLGSVASPRMVEMINAAAHALRSTCTVHLVGLNKACMYGGDTTCSLDPLVVDHGERYEQEVWDYVRHARIGLALATGPHAFDNDVSKILNYLRGGLPVLSEEPIVNNDLIIETGFGRIFKHGDVNDLVSKAKEILTNSFGDRRESVAWFMANGHSWDKRVDAYVNLFNSLV